MVTEFNEPSMPLEKLKVSPMTLSQSNVGFDQNTISPEKDEKSMYKFIFDKQRA
jgi:hypothetical protein